MSGVMNRFGGVWKNLLVEWPGSDCLDATGYFLVFHVPSGSLSLWKESDREVLRRDSADCWWLDRRIPKSLLPEEAFDLVKVLHPNMTCLKRTKAPSWTVIGGHDRIPVEWGERGAYMPESEGRWVDVTKDNWLAYLHWDCEYGLGCGGERFVGKLVGLDLQGGFVVLFKGGGLGRSLSVRVMVGVDGKSVLATEGDK